MRLTYREALAVTENHYGRDHPEVAIDLNNIGAVLGDLGEHAEALVHYREVLDIFERRLPHSHPLIATVRRNRDVARRAWMDSLSEQERWRVRIEQNLAALRDSTGAQTDDDRLDAFSALGVSYIEVEQPDSALVYLREALPLAEALDQAETVGVVLNNIGSAHKSRKDWSEAEAYLRRSVAHNTAIQGDSAAVLAYTHFHLAGVLRATARPDSARHHAAHAEALAARHELAALLEEIQALRTALGEPRKEEE